MKSSLALSRRGALARGAARRMRRRRRTAATAAPRREPLRKHTVTPPGLVPGTVPRPSYAREGVPDEPPEEMLLYSAEQVDGIRRACALAAEVREFAASLVRPGVTGSQVDAAAHARIVAYGAYPAPLNYMGFPKSVCFSVNEVVCHGVPDERPLADGDVVSIDVSVYVNGYFGDCCGTYEVGAVDDAARRLVEATRLSLDRAIAACAPGVPFSRIGDEVCDVAEPLGLGVVESFCGHGIGTYFHAAPSIFHCRNSRPEVMDAGMVFTIEPMVTEGLAETVRWPDQWTILTRDGSRCAQFEETLALREDGSVEVLTHTRDFDAHFTPLPA